MREGRKINDIFIRAYSLLKNMYNRIMGRVKSKNIILVYDNKREVFDGSKEFYYFKNINECVKFIDTNYYGLSKGRKVKCLSINLHFINCDNEEEIKSVGVLKKPFVKIKEKINRNIVKINTRRIPVRIKFLRLQIKFRTNPT